MTWGEGREEERQSPQMRDIIPLKWMTDGH